MFIHNMRMGCGLEVRVVKGRRYLYFWRYGGDGGCGKRRWKYLGPVENPETTRKALSEMSAAYDAAVVEMERKLRIIRAKLARLR